MITKGIIEEIVSQYEIIVRIPILDSVSEFSESTSNANLSTAIVCVQPKFKFIPEVGDIVILGFEDNDKGKPIILGCLFKESGNTSQVNTEVQDLVVNGTAKLNKQTIIGDVTYSQLEYLLGLNENINAALTDLDKRLRVLEENS